MLNGGALGHALSKGVGVPLPKYPLFPTKQLSNFHVKSDGFSLGAPFADDNTQADPYFPTQTTGLVATISTTALSVRPAAVHAPVDVRNCNIRGRYRPIANLLPNSSTMNTWEIRLYSTGSPAAPPANYHRVNFSFGATYKHLSASDGTSRWQWHSIGVNVFNAVGSGADLSAITHEAWILQAASSNVTLGVGPIDAVPNPRSKAVVIFTWDDAVETPYSVATPLLDAIGKQGQLHPGAIASASAGLDAFGRMTKAQAKELHNKGWCVGSQAYDTESTQPDYASYLNNEVIPMLAYGAAAGWHDDSYHGSYFSNAGPNTQPLYRAMKDRGMITARRFDNGNATLPPTPHSETFPLSDPGNYHALNMAQPGGSGSAITTYVQSAIDQAVAAKGVMVLSMHDDLTNSNVLQAFNDVITRYTNVGDFDIMTLPQLLAPYLAQYGADPYWTAA